MSGNPNVLDDGNHLEVLRRHVRDESIDLVYGVSSDPWWQEVMERAFGWFLGDNDLGMRLADPDDGSCRDSLGPDGVNGNMGAESTLAWLVAVERMRALHNEASARPAELMAGGAGGVTRLAARSRPAGRPRCG
jgi:hypothetical protein